MSCKNNSTEQGVKIGLLGFGIRLQSVVTRLLALSDGAVEVAAVCDPAEAATEQAATLYGDHLVRYASEEEFLAHPGLDWVFIGSPNYLHASQVVAALRAGMNVFCEKPLATHFEDCLFVREAIQESGKIFAFGLVLRYSPFYQEIRKILDRGDIGRLISFEFNETLDFDHGGRRIFSTWRRDYDLAGSHLLEKCCHDLDIANWLVGSLPVQVASFGGLDFFHPRYADRIKAIGPAPDGREAYRPPETERGTVHPFSEGATIIDNQVAILQYANGVRATFHTNCNTALRERRFYLCGTEGTLQADAYTGAIEWRRIGYDTEVQRVQAVEGGGQGHAGGDEVMAANLLGAMRYGAPLLADVDDGVRACAVAFAIDQAMEEQRVVDLSEIWERCGLSSTTGVLASRSRFPVATIPVSSGV